MQPANQQGEQRTGRQHSTDGTSLNTSQVIRASGIRGIEQIRGSHSNSREDPKEGLVTYKY
jgi:hypothetical protein